MKIHVEHFGGSEATVVIDHDDHIITEDCFGYTQRERMAKTFFDTSRELLGKEWIIFLHKQLSETEVEQMKTDLRKLAERLIKEADNSQSNTSNYFKGYRSGVNEAVIAINEFIRKMQ